METFKGTKELKETKELKQLKVSDILPIRNEILELQSGKCAICGDIISEKTGISADHQHKSSIETIGEDGAGLIRGVLCRGCNTLEGKIWNNMNRFKQPKNVNDRIKWLEELLKYYKSENYPYIHPNEKPKEPKVSKRNYNKLAKLYKDSGKKKKFPEYPKSGKLTVGLKTLFEEFQIEPFN